MSTTSRIEWTQTTWNPVTGCDRISPGCQHCYALTLAGRLQAMGQAKYQTEGDPRTRACPQRGHSQMTAAARVTQAR